MYDFIFLADAIPDIVNNGLFQKMENAPFNTFDLKMMDIDFITKYGNRLCGSLIKYFLRNNENDILTDEQLTKIADYLEKKYETAWKRKYDLLSVNYNPIHNYDRKEEEETTNTANNTDNITKTGTIKNDGTSAITGNVTNTNDLTTQNNGSSNTGSTSNNDVYGFNSTTAVHDNSNNGTSDTTVNNTTKDTGTVKQESTNNNTVTNTETFNTTDGHTITRNEVIKRINNTSGNIGVTTSQQMLQSEIDLWSAWNFYNDIMETVANELTLLIY